MKPFTIGKSAIPWATHSWSPVIGCLRGCPYCYAKKLVERFSDPWIKKEIEYRVKNDIDYEGLIEERASYKPVIMYHRLNEIIFPKKPSAIFCNPLSDIEYWKRSCRKRLSDIMHDNPQHLFMLLTKNGSVYKKWPDLNNLAFGYTATDPESLLKQSLIQIHSLRKHKNIKMYLSLEPLHEFCCPDFLSDYEWVIVGTETGNRRNKVIPERGSFQEIRDYCFENKIPLFEKGSISSIIGAPLVQQFPSWHPKAKEYI